MWALLCALPEEARPGVPLQVRPAGEPSTWLGRAGMSMQRLWYDRADTCACKR